MAAKKIFFCLRANQTHLPRSKETFLLYFVRANEASESNQHKEKIIFFGRHLCNQSMRTIWKQRKVSRFVCAGVDTLLGNEPTQLV